jgi:uncharacterized membrane protein
MINLRRFFLGHLRTFGAAVIGLAILALLPQGWTRTTRGILAWDAGAAAFLILCGAMVAGASPARMEANARSQEEGEWTLFTLVLACATASFAAILVEFGSMKNAAPDVRDLKVSVVVATLALSWLLMQAIFALRYAHEYYSRTGAAAAVDGGLDFPSDDTPDYWDFLYFSVVLGMTFQVSDVQITSRKLRRLATLHGMLGFVFNTVIVALTVNLASSLLS